MIYCPIKNFADRRLEPSNVNPKYDISDDIGEFVGVSVEDVVPIKRIRSDISQLFFGDDGLQYVAMPLGPFRKTFIWINNNK